MGTQGNRNLRSETGKHSDAGIEQGLFNNSLFVNITYFRWDIEDKISWIPDASFFYRPQNLDRYKSHGFEIGLEARPLNNLTFSLAYTFTDAEEEISGGVARKALYTSDSYFKSSMKYLNDSGFNTSATIRYTGERPAYYIFNIDTEPSVTLDSYYTIDLKLEKDFFDKWIVSLQCNNLLDKEYDTYVESFIDQASGIMTMERYPGEGRSFFFKVSYRY
jgi:iron complex outermembrane receptor protein